MKITESQLTLDAWLLEIFQIGRYEDTGLRTYDGSGASTGVDENWPGGDDDITSVDNFSRTQYLGLVWIIVTIMVFFTLIPLIRLGCLLMG